MPKSTGSRDPSSASHDHAEFAALLHALPIAAYRCDRHGFLTDLNAAAEAILGFTPPLNDPSSRYCPAHRLLTADAQELRPEQSAMALALASGKARSQSELVIERPNGQRTSVRLDAQPILDLTGSVGGGIGILVPSHEQSGANESALNTEKLFRLFMDHNPAAAWLKDESGRYVYVSAAFERSARVKSRDVIGKTDFEIMPLELATRVRAHDLEVLELNHMAEYHEVVQAPVGTQLQYAWVFKFPFCDAEGRRFVAGVGLDETDRVQTEIALRQSEARLVAMIDHSPGVAVQWYDLDGTVCLWNKASEEMFGFTAEEAIGKKLLDLIHTPEEHADFLATLQSIARTGEPAGPVEYGFRRRSGESGTCLSTVFRIPEASGGQRFVCMDIDITAHKKAEEERHKLEDQMRHAQKLESLGILAGGIAHDFNNLLTSVLGYAELAAREVAEDSPARSMLREIEMAAQRAAELTRQMLAYSGRGKFQERTLRLDALVSEMSTLLHTVVSKKATFHMECAPATIDGDATQLQQIVMNLITNASDALDGQPGEIRVRTGIRRMSQAALRSPFIQEKLPAGDYAYLEVEDTGCGMAEETLSKIFDPFFSTKFTGRGLGLAAALGIVRGHRGTLHVKSRPGLGTTFQVYLPCSSNTVTNVSELRPSLSMRSGQGTVLVIDDEENVRELTRVVLGAAGFEVLSAADGLEGLKLLKLHADEIGLVLLDLTMPRMDGAEVLQALQEQQSKVPVVLMSGFDEPELPQSLEKSQVAGFLQKPFRIDDLTSTVVQELQSRRA